jgi:AcrR family transcriptional regulator
MPKIVDHEERKREIVRSALLLFSQQGYHNTSFSDIASACGLSRTNVYNYFKNKDEIFHYAVGELLNSIGRNMELIIQQKDLSPRLKLQKKYQLFTNDIGEGKYTSIILDLALKLKRENTQLAAALDEAAKKLRLKIEMLLVGERTRFHPLRTASVTTLFFSLIESSILHSLFTESAFIQQNIGAILQMLGT